MSAARAQEVPAAGARASGADAARARAAVRRVRAHADLHDVQRVARARSAARLRHRLLVLRGPRAAAASRRAGADADSSGLRAAAGRRACRKGANRQLTAENSPTTLTTNA